MTRLVGADTESLDWILFTAVHNPSSLIPAGIRRSSCASSRSKRPSHTSLTRPKGRYNFTKLTGCSNRHRAPSNGCMATAPTSVGTGSLFRQTRPPPTFRARLTKSRSPNCVAPSTVARQKTPSTTMSYRGQPCGTASAGRSADISARRQTPLRGREQGPALDAYRSEVVACAAPSDLLQLRDGAAATSGLRSAFRRSAQLRSANGVWALITTRLRNEH